MGTTDFVLLENWGRDHWSTLLYLDHVVQNVDGVPDRRKMRCDPDLHPGLAHAHSTLFPKRYPTKLKAGKVLHGHDDWDCVEDLEAAGLLEWQGTGINPVIVMTTVGHKVVAEAREHRVEHKSCDNFTPSIPLIMAGKLLAKEKELGIGAYRHR